MHRFTDSYIDEVQAYKHDVTIWYNHAVGYINLSKEDLLHLLKLIEETN